MRNDNPSITNPESPGGRESKEEEPGRAVEANQTPEETSAPSAAEAPADPAAAYQKVLAEKRELYDRLLRKQAELENFRKRLQREKEEFLQHATADLIRGLLPTLDAFERALKHRESSIPEHFYEGIELIYRQLVEVLSRAGLAAVKTAGEIFDPHLHQAVETVEAPGYRDQEIVEELQRGYKLKHRLLRPAIVKVAVSPRREDPEPESEESDQVGLES